jgi:hypothetical protein
MVAAYNHWTLLLQVLLALVCLTKLSCGFNAATSLPSVTVAPSVLTSKASAPNNRWGESSKKCRLQLRAHRDSTTTHHHVHHSSCRNYSSSSSLRSSGLFPQRHRSSMHTSSRLQMTTTPKDTNNDTSSSSDNNKNVLVRFWLKLRAFVARLWVGHTS